MKLSLSLVIQADAPSSSMRACESESNCLPNIVILGLLFAHVVVMMETELYWSRGHLLHW